MRGRTQVIQNYTEEQLIEYIASLLYELHLNEIYEHVKKINEEKLSERGYILREITVKIDTTLDYINDKHEYSFFILCREPSASFNDVQNFIETDIETRIASASSEARRYQEELTAAESKFIQEMVIYCTLKDMKETGKLRYYEHRDFHVY
ncbi:MAG: hypothetical protein K6F29_03800, partial [Bacteroidales bacterium]|nr:hypothetical protein [Bacteroidales bacterium]